MTIRQRETLLRIDTKDGIVAMLGNGSLAGLATLQRERARWRKEFPDWPLNEWYVMNGRYVLDRFGQIHTCSFEPDGIDWVSPPEPRPGLRITWSSRPVPRDTDRCVHCDGEITTRQLEHLFVSHYDSETDRVHVFHRECRYYWIDEKRRTEFVACFAKAAGPDAHDWEPPFMFSRPSGYSETEWTGPWYRVEDQRLGVLTLGWRKNVIHLSWETSEPLAGVDGMALFAADKVTCGPDLVHCWGYDKLTEYLGRLAKEIS